MYRLYSIAWNTTLNDHNLNPLIRKKQLLRRIKGLGLTMVPLKSRTKILNIEKEPSRNVYTKFIFNLVVISLVFM